MGHSARNDRPSDTDGTRSQPKASDDTPEVILLRPSAPAPASFKPRFRRYVKRTAAERFNAINIWYRILLVGALAIGVVIGMVGAVPRVLRSLDRSPEGVTRVKLSAYQSANRAALLESYPLGYVIYGVDGQRYSPPPVSEGLRQFVILPGADARLAFKPEQIQFTMPAIRNRRSTVQLAELTFSLPRRDGARRRHPLSAQVGCDVWVVLRFEPPDMCYAVVGLKELPKARISE